MEGLVEILWRNFKWERALKGTEYLVIVIIIIIIIIIIIWGGGGGMADWFWGEMNLQSEYHGKNSYPEKKLLS